MTNNDERSAEPTSENDREEVARTLYEDAYNGSWDDEGETPLRGAYLRKADRILALGFRRVALAQAGSRATKDAYRDALREFLKTYQDGRGVRPETGSFAWNAATAAFKAAWDAAQAGSRAAQTTVK